MAGIHYTIVLSTHDHVAPDLMGLWGKSQYQSGVNAQYMAYVKQNDEIGYIIPKSEWDESSPYLYMADKSPYGEINSLGPETAPIIHRKIKVLLGELDE